MSQTAKLPDMLEIALEYADHGFRVIPLGSPFDDVPDYLISQCGSIEEAKKQWPKTPRIRWAKFQKRFPTQEEINQWWSKWPRANIGIITGPEICVVDADSSEAAEWVKSNLTRSPWEVKTGNGMQFYYSANEVKIHNSVNPHKKVDVRGVGGYVVAPGSTHANGRVYEWIVDHAYEAKDWHDLPPLAGDDIKKIGEPRQGEALAGSKGISDGFSIDTSHISFKASGDPVNPGGRNSAAASLIGQDIQKQLSLQKIWQNIWNWNQTNPEPLDDPELQKTLLSICGTHLTRNPTSTVAEIGEAANDVLFTPEKVSVGYMLDNPPPTMPWLIPDFLPAGKVGMVIAPGGTGKGWLTLQLCVSLACGFPFLGQLTIPKPSRCLILAAEDDRDDLHRRLTNVISALGLNAEQKELLRQNLYLHSLEKGSCLLTQARHGELHYTKYLKDLCTTLEQFPDLGCVVLDPTSRFRGGEENKAEDNTRYVEALEILSARIGISVLVTHHANKNSMREGDAGEAFAARGSSALTDGVRLQINLTYLDKAVLKSKGITESDSRLYLSLSMPKTNYTKPFESRILYRNPDNGTLSVVDLPSDSQAREKAEYERVAPEVLRLLQEHENEYSLNKFCSRYGGVKKGELKVNEKRLREALKKMIDENLIKETDGKASNGKTVKLLSAAEPWDWPQSDYIDLVTGEPIQQEPGSRK